MPDTATPAATSPTTAPLVRVDRLRPGQFIYLQPEPGLQHLSVHQPVIDPDQRHALGAHAILLSASLTWPIAFCPASAKSRATAVAEREPE